MENLCKVRIYTCIINAMCFFLFFLIILYCWLFFLSTFSCCFPFHFTYLFLTLVCRKGKNKEISRKQSEGKGKKRAKEEETFLRKVFRRPVCW